MLPADWASLLKAAFPNKHFAPATAGRISTNGQRASSSIRFESCSNRQAGLNPGWESEFSQTLTPIARTS